VSDNALEFQVITAEGRFVTANAKENPDLYWALKGGGPGTYAVVLSTTFATFDDLPSTGLILDINSSHTSDMGLWWSGVRSFNKYSNHFVDAGLYVYFELMPLRLHVQPILAINQTAAQLNATVKPLLDELDKLGLKYSASVKEFKTFYDLYLDLFEDEQAGQTALTGGWAFSHADVAANNSAIVDAYKTTLDSGGIVIGHMWTQGKGVTDSAVNPRFKEASNKVIAALPVGAGASVAEKVKAQDTLTNVVDAALRKAGPGGCAYVNEVSRICPILNSSRRRTRNDNTDNDIGRPVPAQLAAELLGDKLPEALRYPETLGSQGRLLRRVDARDRRVGDDRFRDETL